MIAITNQTNRVRHNNANHASAALRAAIEPLEARTLLSSYIVNTFSDATNLGPGVMTLRQAVAAANAHPGPDSIYFRMDLFNVAPVTKTITLTHGEIDFNDPTGATTVTGAENRLIINGNHAGRVFGIAQNSSVSLVRMAITNGVAGIVDKTNAEGGGIFNAGTLSLNVVTVSNCSATGVASTVVQAAPLGQGLGGGIFSRGSLTITNSTIINNRATGASNEESDDNFATYGGLGGGAGICSLGPLTVGGSIISDNIATGGNADKPVHFDDRTVGGPAMGAGIFGTTTVVIKNSCIIGENTAIGGNARSTVASGGGATGAGIFAGLQITLSNSRVADNKAQGGTSPTEPFPVGVSDTSGGGALGGGLYSNGPIAVTSATFAGNKAVGGPGGVPTFAGSGGDALGGAVYGSVAVSATSSTFSTNSATGGNVGGEDSASQGGAAKGGAIYSTGALTITNCTVASNSVTGGTGVGPGVSGPGIGGGIFAAAAAKLFDSTLSANTSKGGVGHAPGSASGGGVAFALAGAVLDNTIVSGNKAGSAFNDISGTVSATSAANLIGIGGGLTNGVNGNKVGITDPKLAPLGFYGVLMQTMAPLVGSPAIDAGNNSVIPAGVTTDQRGFSRIVGGRVDIGAVELSRMLMRGAVYNDINGDGVRQTGEPGMAGVQVYVDANNAGIFVSGDPVATTDASGNYVLTSPAPVAQSSLIIREVRPPTMRRTQPAGIYPLGFYTINSGASTVSNINFGNSLTALVTGTVYNDFNSNKKMDAGEAGLADWNIHADYKVNNVPAFQNVLTDAKGNYSLVLPAGTCTVSESLRPGFNQTYPPPLGYTLTLSTGATVTGLNFGND